MLQPAWSPHITAHQNVDSPAQPSPALQCCLINYLQHIAHLLLGLNTETAKLSNQSMDRLFLVLYRKTGIRASVKLIDDLFQYLSVPQLQPKFPSSKCAFSAGASRDSKATQAVEGNFSVTGGSPKQRTCTFGLQPQRRDAAAWSLLHLGQPVRGECVGARYSSVVWNQQPGLYQHCNNTTL